MAGVEQVNLFGITNDGKLWQTTRVMHKSEAVWDPWQDVKALAASDPGPFISAACDGQLLGLHICAVTNDGKLWHASRSPQWQPFEDVKARIGGDWGELRDVGVALLNDELHVCVTALTSLGLWGILHTTRHADDTWDSFEDVNALTAFPGSFISIDCTNVKGELHVCGVSDDGKLWHTLRSSQNSWLPFEDVQATASNAPDAFASVSITGGDGDLHVCAQAGGDLWHTIRFSSDPPSWQSAFENVKEEAGDPGSFGPVGCTSFQGELQVSGVTDDGKLWHTIRYEQPPGWLEFEDIAAVVGNPDPGLFIFVTMLGLIVALFDLIGPPECENPQQNIYSDCFRIHHTKNRNKIATLQADIQNIENTFMECTFDVPCSS
jgi:hypothetical protein